MDAYNDSTVNKRKLLIPLVVLMLCSVALTGAAYAYNAQLDGESEDIDVDTLILNFDSATSEGKFNFYLGEPANPLTTIAYKSSTSWVAGSPGSWVTKYAIDDSPADGYLYSFKVKSVATTVNGESVPAKKFIVDYDSDDISIALQIWDADQSKFVDVEDSVYTVEFVEPVSQTSDTTQTVTVKVTVDAPDTATWLSQSEYSKIKYQLVATIVGTTETA